VLDIGCGMGAGLLYAHAAFPAARLVGVDTSTAALKDAWRRLSGVASLELRCVPGDRTLLPPHRFDLILSVGSVNAIGPTEMLVECARLLAPGGVVSIIARFHLQPEAVVTLFHAAAWQAGLTLRCVTDITADTTLALEHDRPWLERVVAAFPVPLRATAREAAGLPGSRSARAIAEGRLRSYSILVDSPAARWEPPRLLAA
jgi:SAM-dependent methyltransferase